MTTNRALDQTNVDAFTSTRVEDVTGASTVLSCSLGDQCGWVRELERRGPASRAARAERAGMQQRAPRTGTARKRWPTPYQQMSRTSVGGRSSRWSLVSLSWLPSPCN